MPRMPQYRKDSVSEQYIIIPQNIPTPTPTPEPTPVIGAYIYFYNDSYIPKEIDNNWAKNEINYSIKDTGIKHTYSTIKDSYLAFAYPSELGELKHIYQNKALFDLLDNFEMSLVEKDGMKYYLYCFKDIIIAGTDEFEFLW